MRIGKRILSSIALMMAATIPAAFSGCARNDHEKPGENITPLQDWGESEKIPLTEISYPEKTSPGPVYTATDLSRYPAFTFSSRELIEEFRFESPVDGSVVNAVCVRLTGAPQVRKGQDVLFYLNGEEAGRYSRDTGSQYVDLTAGGKALVKGENVLTAVLPSGTKFDAELVIYSDLIAAKARLSVSESTGKAVSDALFGMNMEITRSCWYGGLSAELLNNRKFYAIEQVSQSLEAWSVSSGRTVTDDKARSICVSNYVVLDDGGELRYSDELRLDYGKEYVFEVWTASDDKNNVVSVYVGDSKLGEFCSGREAEAHKFSFMPVGNDGNSGGEPSPGERLTVRSSGGEVKIFEASLLPADNFYGMSIDAVSALKTLAPAALRYPGGCCADRFDWRESLKPAAFRKPMEANESGFTGMGSFLFTSTFDQDTLDLGLEEFFLLCEEIGAKAELTVSLVRGNEKDAAELVKYCLEKSHVVSSWFIGNEVYYFGDALYRDPLLAAAITDNYITAMREVQPDLCAIVGACDTTEEMIQWTKTYFGRLGELGTRYDLISVHNYYGAVDTFPDRFKAADFLRRTCSGFISSELPVVKSIEKVLEEAVPGLTGEKGLYLDEWNWTFGLAPSTMMFLGNSTYMLSAIGTGAGHQLSAASFFHPFEGMIASSGNTRELAGTGYAYELLKAHIGGDLLSARIDSDNASALVSAASGVLTVSVVNLNNESLLLDLSSVRDLGFGGNASYKVIRANTLSLHDVATLSSGSIELFSAAAPGGDPEFAVLVPGCSFVQITVGNNMASGA